MPRVSNKKWHTKPKKCYLDTRTNTCKCRINNPERFAMIRTIKPNHNTILRVGCPKGKMKGKKCTVSLKPQSIWYTGSTARKHCKS